VKKGGKKLEYQLARALWDEAGKAGLEEKCGEELGTLAEVVRGEPRLRQILLHPSVSLGRKVELVASSLSLSQPVSELVRAIVVLKAPGMLAGVRRAYLALLSSGAREVTVSVASAGPLSAPERKAIADTMSKILRKPVRVTVSTRKELLGGILVRVGERIFDGSLKGEFDRLERELVASSSQKTSSGVRKAAHVKGRK
jgi:F-type H+-transporting ATPase subunit delta